MTAASCLPPPYDAFITTLILTGQRSTEVAAISWREVDLARKIGTLPKERAKNRVEHAIPLSSMTVSILAALPRFTNSDFVFTRTGKAPIYGFHRVKHDLDRLMPPGTAPWVLHDVRRSFASALAGLGVQLPVIEKLLNHTSGSFAGIVGVYQKYTFADEKRQAVETWAKHIEQLMSGEGDDRAR